MTVKRPVIIDGLPHVSDYFRKNAAVALGETGGNTGNLAFRYAIASHLVDPVFLNWGTPAAEIKASGDILVLPLANQLGRHTNLGTQASRLIEIGLPILALGLGAQSPAIGEDIALTDGTLSWLKEIATRAPSDHANIGVRGRYTSEQIAKLGWAGAASVMGCPSNFLNLKDDIAGDVARGFQRKPRRIAVTAGIPYITQLASLEQRLAEIVTQTNGAYIVQHDIEMVRLARCEFEELGPDLLKLCKDYISPSSSDEDFKLWARQYAYAFFDVPAWMDFLRRFDFVVGTRFHGVMLAIQAGVAAGCIAHDSRTMELCQTMGVPVCHHAKIGDDLTRDNIMDFFQFDAEAYTAIRQDLRSNYVGILQSGGVAINADLTKGV